MSEEADRKQFRKPYVKPTLTQIKLMPEESALAGCKYNNMAGPGYSRDAKCRFLGIGQSCNAIRSS